MEKDRKEMCRENIWKLISAMKAHRKLMSERLDATGVYQGQHRILMHLSEHTCDSQKKIAKQMNISTATLAVSIKKLEAGGYLEKAMNQSDNRVNTITITEKGRKVVEQSYQIFPQVDCQAFDGFTEEEMEKLASMLDRIKANLETEKEENMR